MIWRDSNKLSESIIVKLSGVVRDENLENSKSTNDTFPHKILGIFLGDFGKWLCFYPLGEIINGDDQKLFL